MSIENYLKVKHAHKAMADKSAIRKATFRRITEQRFGHGCDHDAEQESKVETVQHGGGIYQESNQEGVGELKGGEGERKPSQRTKSAKKTGTKG